MNLTNQGIRVSPQTVRSGELVRLNYNGLLAQSGADQVYLHTGYGDSWQYVSDLAMQRTADGWQKVFPVEHPGSLCFCFKDSANNWDNNNGQNWNIPIEGLQFTR